MSVRRYILLLLASVLVWVFAHDYAALHINNRIDSQLSKAQAGDLNFSWDVKQTGQRVTVFGSQFDGQYFSGKQAAVSLKMPAWPLIPLYYQDLSVAIETDPAAKFTMALETSDPDAGLFYTAKVDLQPGAHQLLLSELDWQTSSGDLVNWVAIPKASTWVVRLFSRQELKWDIKSLSLNQTEAFGSNQWLAANCGQWHQKGQWLVFCPSSNEMVQIDHQVNQKSTTQQIKFETLVSLSPWLLLLLVALLLVLVFWGLWAAQLTGIMTLSVAALLLYVPLDDATWLGYKWMSVMLPVLLFVVYINRGMWQLSQKGSLRTWMFVVVLAGFLWSQSDFQWSFLNMMPGYLLWAGFQQSLMVSLFEWVRKHNHQSMGVMGLSVFVAWCFAVIHLPNHYLMVLTFAAGLFWMWVWQKQKNLILMVFSHALWALLLYQWVGETWLYSARVGFNFL
ncbi:CPBP family glutamic-type intramembrane protease [Marinicella rhabdoformis]|uniref:CPBP family glutamic-type intramembrane protease n=1 Tax=Marinicella rhabdoformis TaxID=2580566 RepID=UPI0012AEBA9F|nr:CPBP family glutamic-type intramembrane protease [Marinicella rhabdoformis]